MDDLAACTGSVRAKLYAQYVTTVFPHNKGYEVCRCDVLWDNKKLYKNSQARNYFNFDKSLRHHVNVHWYARYDAHSEHFILHARRLDVM